MTTDHASTPPAIGSQRPGGRAARVRAAVLGATLETLGEVGYEALSIDVVASRAGVHKTTVYRRWPAKVDLVAEAVLDSSAERVPLPDTGSLAEDLRLFARAVAANLQAETSAAVTRALVAATTQSVELDEAMTRYWAERFARARVMIERAAERGEIDAAPDGLDPEFLIEALIGPLWVRFLLTGRPIDTDVADRAAALVATSLGGRSAGSQTGAETG